MAEVLSPYSPSSGPANIIQDHRQSSPHDASARPRSAQMQRNNPSGGSGYRGTSPAPTYAFKATPDLKNSENRSALPPQPPSPGSSYPPLSSNNASAGNRQRYPAPPSVSTTNTSSSTSSSANHQHPQQQPAQTNAQPAGSTWSSLFKTNDNLSKNFQLAPFSTDVNPSLGDPLPAPSTSTALTDASTVKQSPDRYRRSHRRVETTGSAAVLSHVTPEQTVSNAQNGTATGPAPLTTNLSAASKDTAMESPVSAGAEQNANSSAAASLRRYRRRGSGSTLDSKIHSPIEDAKSPGSSDGMPQRPTSSQQERSASPSGRASSGRLDGSSGPARTFAEVARRTNTPSPLSRPMTPSESQLKPSSPSSPPDPTQHSPAVAAMAALNDRDLKGSKSRWRRAFSFGSTTDFKRATEGGTAMDRTQARKEQFSTELDEEQDAIAKQQEAAGLGENIYSGQAGFIGSTDNLSISSTASSASLMLRKMGRGMKKGGRSIKGLFRPKSAIGVPPPDGPLGASIGEISRVTVEAEREKVNVNAHPQEQTGGGTGFPKLGRNSVDAIRASISDDLEHSSRDKRPGMLSIEHEKQEVLAGVRKSILKRTNTSSPQPSPTMKPADAGMLAQGNGSFERRASPSPSNASSEARRNGRGSGNTNGEDYFGAPRHGAHGSRSHPGTPRGVSRNISFSPRLQFHDVWSSTDYDRRGDIATCNRLTPMLAQQIKEELNSFKMEMEVHEASKPFTHFF